jgi:hypothetical protein
MQLWVKNTLKNNHNYTLKYTLRTWKIDQTGIIYDFFYILKVFFKKLIFYIFKLFWCIDVKNIFLK